MSPTVSVIMPTYNSARYLERCLASFREQSYDDWELLCVDRGSDDGTREILERVASEWGKLRILDGGSERTSQINIGVRASESRYIYYTASDFIVDRDLLAEAVGAADAADADAVYVDCMSHGDHLWARVRHLERSTYIGGGAFEAARFFRRTSYAKVGGYDDAVPIFEEYDLQDRLLAAGATFARIRAREYHLGEPRSLGEIWRKSFYYGEQYRNLVAKQGRDAIRHVNPIRSSFFSHWREFARHPFLTLAFALMLVAKYGGGAAGFLVTFVRKR